MTRTELMALPPSVAVETAGRALGLGRTKSHELVRAGEFPVRVLRLGNAYRVPTADLLVLLGVEPAEPGGAA
ncbi:MAG: DNA-binding protein [Pseudonocardiaceae bacterium]